MKQCICPDTYFLVYLVYDTCNTHDVPRKSFNDTIYYRWSLINYKGKVINVPNYFHRLCIELKHRQNIFAIDYAKCKTVNLDVSVLTCSKINLPSYQEFNVVWSTKIRGFIAFRNPWMHCLRAIRKTWSNSDPPSQ